MTAEEIRELNVKLQEKMLATKAAAAYDGAYKSMQLSLLAEIAAQIAELNTKLLLVRDATEAIAIDGISVKVRQ